jgi:hypothetical protein
LIVDAPGGEVATEHVDARRTNASPDPLPSDALRIVWSRQIHPMDHPPVIARDGTIIVLGKQGEATLIHRDGTDRGHVAMGPGPMSAPALLADGTLVAINAAGDLVGVRGTSVVFRTHLGATPGGPAIEPPHVHRPHLRRPSGGGEPASVTRASTLPLADGGLAVAWDHELVSLDAEGTVRSRASSPVIVAVPLVATAEGVAFAADSGDVFEWNLRGSIDPVSARGSFGGPVDGVAVGEDGRHLLAVVRGSHLASLDLGTGTVETRASTSGAFADALALAGKVAFLQELTATGTRVLAVDRDGRGVPFQIMLASHGAFGLPDAGATGAVFAPTQTFLVADPTGAVAYATVDGHVGVATPTAKVELGPLPCGAPASPSAGPFGPRVRAATGFAGLLPAGPRALLIACESGQLSWVTGQEGG